MEKVDKFDTKTKLNEIATGAENENTSKQDINPGNNEKNYFPRTGENNRHSSPWKINND